MRLGALLVCGTLATLGCGASSSSTDAAIDAAHAACPSLFPTTHLFDGYCQTGSGFCFSATQTFF